MDAKYTRATVMCDFDYGPVKKWVYSHTKEASTSRQKIFSVHKAITLLPIGFLPEYAKASDVVRFGRGNCITKTTLCVAALRLLGIPARVHVWRIHKIVHKDHFPRIVYLGTPKNTIFTYPEIWYNNSWKLLSEVVCTKESPSWSSCPFNDARNRKHPLKPEWIVSDEGSVWHPDDVRKRFGTNHDGWRRFFLPVANALLNYYWKV